MLHSFSFCAVMLRGVGIPHFVSWLSGGGHLGCLYLLNVMTNAMNIRVWISMWMCPFFFGGVLGS